MLIPHPESDLTLNIMVMSCSIIKYLKNKSYVFIDTLLKNFMKEDSRRDANLFIECLIFLYMLGIIEHDENYIKIKLVSQN